MNCRLVVALGFLVLALGGRARAQAGGEKSSSVAKKASEEFRRCEANWKTDAAERALLETHTSPGLNKAMQSTASFWKFITDPATAYIDRMAAANRGGSMLKPESLPLLWEAMVEVNSLPSGVRPPPCSAVVIPHDPPTVENLWKAMHPGAGKSKETKWRMVLGRKIRPPTVWLNYPVSEEERGHAPWLWQMQNALELLFDKTNRFYGDVRYPARVKAAWDRSIRVPGEPGRLSTTELDQIEWSKLHVRSRALTEWAPRDVLLFQTILKLALQEDQCIPFSVPVQDLESWGPDHHLEELPQAAQIIILQRTKREDLAALTAFEVASCAQRSADPENGPHAKLVKSATAILAIGRWATNASIGSWNRYYSFVQPITRMVEDPPFSPDWLSNPEDPRVAERLKIFETWYALKQPELERQAEGERAHLRSLAKELNAETE